VVRGRGKRGLSIREVPKNAVTESSPQRIDGDAVGRARSFLHRWVGDAGGIVVVVLVGVASVLPALLQGSTLGPFDQLSTVGLSVQHGVVIHNILSSDQIRQMIPWTALDWRDVHSGHLPLWNPYSVLGMPLAFNWQSAPFSPPLLIGYLFPLRLAYGVGVLVKLFIAGTGAYVFARVLRIGVLGSVLAGIVFELSGAFSVWAGYTLTGVAAWTGWVLAATALVLSGRHRWRFVVFLGVAVAMSVYGGDPEETALLLLGAGVFAVVLLALRARGRRDDGPIARPLVDLAGALVLGLALSAPLLLPGLQVAGHSVRTGPAGGPMPLSTLVNVAFARFFGTPVVGTTYFGPANYYATAAYVGVIALGLAAVGVYLRWRRPQVPALLAMAGVFAVFIYIPFAVSEANRVPGIQAILWWRALPVLALTPAVLAGLGLDALLAERAARRVLVPMAVAFGVLGLAVAAVGGYFLATAAHMPSLARSARGTSFVWPLVGVGAGLASVVVLASCRNPRQRARLARPVAIVLVVVECAFLLTSAQPLWSSSSGYFSTTPAERALEQRVGTAVVGFGSCPQGVAGVSTLGMLVNTNDAYGVVEFSDYDGMTPRGYYTSWAAATKTPLVLTPGNFCPAVTSVALARRYGVSYILEPAGAPGPAGTRRVATVGGEGLFFVPGAARATLAPLPGTHPPSSGLGSATVHMTGPGTWTVDVDARTTARLDLRLTDEPGWRASLDGKTDALGSWDGVMLQVTVPAGHHVIVLSYLPRSFVLGVVLCLVALGVVTVGSVVALRRRRAATGGWPTSDPERPG